MAPDETLCLGCLYILPTKLAGFEAEAFCWIRASHTDQLDARLYEVLRRWIDADWPFAKVAYPGRSLTWDEVARLRV